MNLLVGKFFIVSSLAIFMTSVSLSMNKMPLKVSQVQRSVELIHTIDALKYEKEIGRKNEPLDLKISYKKKHIDKNKSIFGFTIASEVINGRLAMLAIVYGLCNEILSGKSLLEQIGLTGQLEQTVFLILMTAITAGGAALKNKKN